MPSSGQVQLSFVKSNWPNWKAFYCSIWNGLIYKTKLGWKFVWPKKNWVGNYFWSTKYLVRIWRKKVFIRNFGPKYFWPKKIPTQFFCWTKKLDGKFCWPKKLDGKFCWPKKFGSEILQSKRNCVGSLVGQKKIWVGKFFGQKMFGSKKIRVEFFLGTE